MLNLLERSSQSSRSVYINYVAVGVFIALAVVTVGGVHAVHLWQVARHTPLVLAEAKKRVANGEDVAALAYYQTYLGYRPTDVDAIAEHALLKAKVAKSPNSAADAYYALMQALPKVPKRNDVRRELVTLGVKLGRVRDCTEELDTLVKDNPDDREILQLAARGAAQMRQFDVARTRYQKLLDLGEDEPIIYQEMLRLLSVELQDQTAADALVLRMVQRHPDESKIRIMAGAYYFSRGQLAQADEHISYAVNELHSTEPAIYRLQTEIARQRRRPLEFEARLTQLANQKQSDLSLEFQLAEVDLSLGRRHLAEERLVKLCQREEVTAEQVWRVIILLDQAELRDHEPGLRERLQTLDTEEKFGPSLAMRDRMRAKEWSAALELARGILRQTDVSPIFVLTLAMWRAECYAQTGELAEEVNCYRRAIDVEPNYQPARLKLAKILFRTGQFQGAQGEYASLIQQSPAFAREFVTDLLAAQAPDAAKPMSAVDVDRLFSRWRESAPKDPMPVLCQLDLVTRQENLEKAAKLTSEGLVKWPQEIGFRINQIDTLLRDKAWENAWNALEAAEANCGQQPQLLIRRIVCLEKLDVPDRQEQLIACTEQFAKLDRDGQAQVWPVLVRGLQRTGIDPQSVDGILNEYGEKNPGDALARIVRLQNAVAAKDLAVAREHLAGLKAVIGENSSTYRLASIMIDVQAAYSGDAAALNRAQAMMQSLRESMDEPSPQMLCLAADIDLLQQHTEEALTHLQEATRLGDPRSSTLTRTISLMVTSNRLEQTVPYLKSLDRTVAAVEEDAGSQKAAPGMLPPKRDLASLRPVLAAAAQESWPLALATFRVDLELKELEHAAEMIQQALRAAPKSPLVWVNWLAYLERHQPDGLAAALEAAGESLSLVDQAHHLPAILLRNKQAKRAQQLLEDAWNAVPNDPLILIYYARILRQQTDKEPVAALLESAMSRTDPESATVREAARREMARFKASVKDYRVYKEAVALAAEIAAEAAPGDDEAWLLKAEVNGVHFGHWREALEACDKLAASPNLKVKASALSQKAKLFELHRNLESQTAALMELNQLVPNQPHVLSQLMVCAIQRKDIPEAKRLHAELTAVTTDSRRQMLADVLLASLDEDRSAIIAKVAAAHQAGEIPVDTALEWLNLLKADEECDQLLKKQLDTSKPTTVAKYAMYLAGRQRAAEAVPHLSQLWKSGARDAAAAVGSAMSASPTVKPADLDALRVSLLKLSEVADTSMPLLATAAALEDHAGNYDSAMALYRRILERFPDNLVALNNLSFLESLAGKAVGDEALERIRLALDRFGPNDQLLDTEGVVLLRRGEAQAARERFQQAWDMKPEINYVAHLAWALTELGEFKAAAEAFQKVDAAETPPRFHEFERTLDESFRKQVQEKQGTAAAVN